MHLFLVERLLVPAPAVLAETLPVVGRQDDRHAIAYREHVEDVQEVRDHPVERHHVLVVGVERAGDLVAEVPGRLRGDAARVVAVRREAVVYHQRMHVLPSVGDELAAKGALVGVGLVGVHIVDVAQERDGLSDVVGALPVEAVVHHARGSVFLVPDVLEHIEGPFEDLFAQVGVGVYGDAEVAGRRVDEGFRVLGHVVEGVGVGLEDGPGRVIERCAGGLGPGRLADAVFVEDAGLGQPVDLRRGRARRAVDHPPVAVAAEVIRAQRVADKEEDVVVGAPELRGLEPRRQREDRGRRARLREERSARGEGRLSMLRHACPCANRLAYIMAGAARK